MYTYLQVTSRRFAAAHGARCVVAARRSSAAPNRASPWTAGYCARCYAASCGWPPPRAAARMRGFGRPCPSRRAAPPVADSPPRTGISTSYRRPFTMSTVHTLGREVRYANVLTAKNGPRKETRATSRPGADVTPKGQKLGRRVSTAHRGRVVWRIPARSSHRARSARSAAPCPRPTRGDTQRRISSRTPSSSGTNTCPASLLCNNCVHERPTGEKIGITHLVHHVPVSRE